MTVTQAWGRLAEVAKRRGLPLEEVLLPAASVAELDAAEGRLGITLHPDLRALYGLTRGLRRARNHDREPRLPGSNFPSLDDAVDRTVEMRQIASGMTDLELWRPTWVQVFDDDDVEIFITDCATGVIWYAWWEADELHPVAPDLATFLSRAAEAADRDDVRYQSDGDYFETPDGEVWEAPLKNPWRSTDV